MVSSLTYTTIAVVSAGSVVGTIALLVIAGLLGFQIVRYVVSASDHPVSLLLCNALTLAIVPLSFVFGMTLAVRFWTMLGLW